MNISEVFKKYKTIAVIGMSKNESKPAHYVPAFLHHNGYKIIPINPTTDEILGLKCYKSLDEVPEYIEVLNVFRPSEEALDIVNEAIKRKKEKGDIELIWLQEGIISEEAKKLAEQNNIHFIQDKCMYKEFVNRTINKD